MSFAKIEKNAIIKLPARGELQAGNFKKNSKLFYISRFLFIGFFFVCGVFSFNREVKAETIFDYSSKPYFSYGIYGSIYFYIPARDIKHINTVSIKISSTDNIPIHSLYIYDDYTCTNAIASSSLSNLSTGSLTNYVLRDFVFDIDIDDDIDFLHFLLITDMGTTNQRVELFDIKDFSTFQPYDGYNLIWAWLGNNCAYTVRAATPNYVLLKMKLTGEFIEEQVCPQCLQPDFPVLINDIPDISLDYQKKMIYNASGTATGYEINQIYSPFKQFLYIVIIVFTLFIVTFLYFRIIKR